MTHPKPITDEGARDLTDVEAAAVRRLLDADVSAAFDYLCLHADAWPGGRGVATRIRSHRRRSVPVAERRAG